MVESADDAAPHLELAAVEEEGSSSQLNRQGNAENDPIASDFVLITRNKKSFLSPVVLAAAAALACTEEGTFGFTGEEVGAAAAPSPVPPPVGEEQHDEEKLPESLPPSGEEEEGQSGDDGIDAEEEEDEYMDMQSALGSPTLVRQVTES
ncbi:hypothetical protein EAH_00067090 [Eimeria acervulina]|uniref:Uncharacterized protein n=1 Tax=Eimeria acervulina TaxID=5801 RepID=U6GTJ8_EIMAC|nr:hypothetical protein EAH_00067090 [Eimeria acervulina]CDI82598.1 hypothetical protein EAH_00067090 [Eimeria acervulina]